MRLNPLAMVNPYVTVKSVPNTGMMPPRFRAHISVYALIALAGFVDIICPSIVNALSFRRIQDPIDVAIVAVVVIGAAYCFSAEWIGGVVALRRTFPVSIAMYGVSAFILLRFVMMLLSASLKWMLAYPVVFVAPFHCLIAITYFGRVVNRHSVLKTSKAL